MNSFKFFSFGFLLLASVIMVMITALPQEGISTNPAQRLQARGEGDATIPDRPEGVGADTFHGSQFQFFDELGFVKGSPGVEAAPVFLYARTQDELDPCYPESAIVLGSNPPKPNPGSGNKRGTGSANPGADCTDPGPHDGAYTLGRPFPVYLSAAFCADSWRVNYDVYYVHDGVLLEGHRHDWEGVTVVFKRDDSGDDLWHRDSVIYNKHGWRDQYDWRDLQTVQVYVTVIEGSYEYMYMLIGFFQWISDPLEASDILEEMIGNKRAHPKVYVGFFSHSAFAYRCDTCWLTDIGSKSQHLADHEYRSNDWWRLPRGEDMHLWSEIDGEWDYGKATNTPPRNREEMCRW
ncbi:hypothetical protein MMC29_005751 [Sticta canariensis]|nr:hypothetical protein [Sticta canariensis]